MLISGENGFLGLRLAERAIEEGFEVTVVDYFSTSNRVNIPDEATIIRGRVGDISLQNNFEHIVNLAATVSVDKIFWQSTKYFSASTNGTSNPYDILIHEKVSLFKIKKIVLASGKSIYCENAYSCNSDFDYYNFQEFSKGVQDLVEWGSSIKSSDLVNKVEKERKFGL